MKRLALLLAALCCLTGPATAHDLRYSVSGAQAVVVKLVYIDNTPFSFERYEIYPADGKPPWQVGRTDALGRLSFLPDRAGTWRIKAISEDGHGLDFTVKTDAAARVEIADRPAYERYGRIVVGVAVLLGLFGFLALFIRRKRP